MRVGLVLSYLSKKNGLDKNLAPYRAFWKFQKFRYMKKYEKISKKMSKNLKNRKCPKNGMWIRGPPFCCQKFRTRPIFPDFVARNFCGPPNPLFSISKNDIFPKSAKNTKKSWKTHIWIGLGRCTEISGESFFLTKTRFGLVSSYLFKKTAQKKIWRLTEHFENFKNFDIWKNMKKFPKKCQKI